VAAARDLNYIRLAELSAKELSGLERLADMGDIEWGSFLELAPADRAVLLPLVDDVLGGLPSGKLHGVEEVLRLYARQAGMAGQFDPTVQGSWGELYAARKLIRMGATELAYQVKVEGKKGARRMDIVADLPGRGLGSVEVKTYLDQAEIVERQVRRDLVAHAPSDYADLMYLYNEKALGQLDRLHQEMLALFDEPELQGQLRAAGIDPAKAKAAFQEWKGLGVYETQ
jgi:hypothetical protein